MTGLARYVAMGGYAAFVWPAYAIALAVLGGITAQSWQRYRASVRALRRLDGVRPQRERGRRG
jgi:heme exporter protein D